MNIRDKIVGLLDDEQEHSEAEILALVSTVDSDLVRNTLDVMAHAGIIVVKGDDRFLISQ